MICPLWTDSWTFMQHCKSLDFVHALKDDWTYCTASVHNLARALSSSLPEKPASWSNACSLYATLNLGRIHNHFCFLHICRSHLLHHVLCFSFPPPAGTWGFYTRRKNTCALPLPQATETMFWRELKWKERPLFLSAPPPPVPATLKPLQHWRRSPLVCCLHTRGPGTGQAPHLEGLQDFYGSCQHGLSDHAVSLM